MALTMPSTALPPPVGASSKNGRDEAKPAFFGGCPSVVSLTFRQSPIIHDPFFLLEFCVFKSKTGDLFDH